MGKAVGLTNTQSWLPTVAAPTKVFTGIAAGVTQRAAVQITNPNPAPVWLSKRAIPPTSIDQADFVVPANSTGTYPLDSDQCSARYNSTIAATDYITLVFSDDDVTAQTFPGVLSTGGVSAPITVITSSVSSGVGTYPKTLNTSSGKNVGSVFVYNNTCLAWEIVDNGPPVVAFPIRPYSWINLPLNVPSGRSYLATAPPTTTAPAGLNAALLNNDILYVAYSDINYVLPFPAGAGVLPNPFTSFSADGIQSAPSQLFFTKSNTTSVAGNVTIYTLGAYAGVTQRILITYARLALHVSVAGNYFVNMFASRGFDGLNSGDTSFLAYNGALDAGSHVELVRQDPVIIQNFDAANPNLIQLGVTAANCFADGYISGYLIQ